MLIPNGENAVVDVRKLTDYCLNPKHPIGKYKARVFESALDLTAADAVELKELLLSIVKTHNAQAGRIDKFGNATHSMSNYSEAQNRQLSEAVG